MTNDVLVSFVRYRLFELGVWGSFTSLQWERAAEERVVNFPGVGVFPKEISVRLRAPSVFTSFSNKLVPILLDLGTSIMLLLLLLLDMHLRMEIQRRG